MRSTDLDQNDRALAGRGLTDVLIRSSLVRSLSSREPSRGMQRLGSCLQARESDSADVCKDSSAQRGYESLESIRCRRPRTSTGSKSIIGNTWDGAEVGLPSFPWRRRQAGPGNLAGGHETRVTTALFVCPRRRTVDIKASLRNAFELSSRSSRLSVMAGHGSDQNPASCARQFPGKHRFTKPDAFWRLFMESRDFPAVLSYRGLL